MLVPALIPNNAENILPAQVGQPTNNPPVSPMLWIAGVLFFEILANLKAWKLNAMLKPTSTETVMAKIILIGIIRTKK